MDRKLYQPIAVVAAGTAVLLMIPLVAMQFTAEVNWTLFDFFAGGILLFGTGLAYVLITRVLAPRLNNDLIYRGAVGLSLFVGLLLIWVNLAVGLIGTGDHPINSLYFGVIVVGVSGALLARFRPSGLQYTMIAMAVAQALIAGFALIAGVQQNPGVTLVEVIGVNSFFIWLFAVSAMMFRYVHKHTIAEE